MTETTEDRRVGAAAASIPRGRTGATPIRLYIAALGGEGGSVLTSWIVALAGGEGWPVQSTSIPGVAQRTGATTYYVEMIPRPREVGESAPILALTPTPGFVDIVVATELLEAGRAMENGFVSPERTTLIASENRAYTIHEKSAMGDERYPSERIVKAMDLLAARTILMNFAEIARGAGSIVNSVVFGAIAGSGVLPISADRFRSVLRDSAVAVEANLRGFEAGLEAVTGQEAEQGAQKRQHTAPGGADAASIGAGLGRRLPAEVETVLRHGIERLRDYQDEAYADRYRGLVENVLAADRDEGGEARAWQLTREAARYLALWLSYEDVIRVAALKTRPERWRQIEQSNPLGERDTLRVTEFLKPGIEELASIMPPRFGRWLEDLARRRGKEDAFNIGLKIRTTSLLGFLMMRTLARLRPWRPHTFRFQQEFPAAVAWIGHVIAAARLDYAFGLEVVECARIRKGYGSTHRRGVANFDAIMRKAVLPALAEHRSAAPLVAELRRLALSDPDGTSMLESVDRLVQDFRAGTLSAAGSPAVAAAAPGKKLSASGGA